MSPENEMRPITRDTLNEYLKALAKEFRKLNGTKMTAEIILTGGAAVLANYGFRELTYDVDAIIHASSAMKDAINRVGDRLGLPGGWLNADLTRTGSYSDKLREVSVHYRTFSSVLHIRTVSAEYLLAMKLMSGRRYKNDLSDIAGILWEHQKGGNPVSREAVENAVVSLYGKDAALPEASRILLATAFETGDYEALYRQVRDSEIESRELLLEFGREHPNELKKENIGDIINAGRRQRAASSTKGTLLDRLEEAKAKARATNDENAARTKDKARSERGHS